MMVLGMATMASAAIEISVNGALDVEEITINVSDTITIDIYNTFVGMQDRNFLSYLDFYDMAVGGYALSNARLGPAAGDFPASFLGPWDMRPDFGEVYEITQAWNPGTPSPVPAGVIFLIDLHCELDGIDVLVNLLNGDLVVVDSLLIHQIPEPMTLALLGIGGLFLKRRK